MRTVIYGGRNHNNGFAQLIQNVQLFYSPHSLCCSTQLTVLPSCTFALCLRVYSNDPCAEKLTKPHLSFKDVAKRRQLHSSSTTQQRLRHTSKAAANPLLDCAILLAQKSLAACHAHVLVHGLATAPHRLQRPTEATWVTRSISHILVMQFFVNCGVLPGILST